MEHLFPSNLGFNACISVQGNTVTILMYVFIFFEKNLLTSRFELIFLVLLMDKNVSYFKRRFLKHLKIGSEDRNLFADIFQTLSSNSSNSEYIKS